MDNPNPEVKVIRRDRGEEHGAFTDSNSLQRKVFVGEKSILLKRKELYPFWTAVTSAELLRDIRDPEHPNTLEELSVIEEECVKVTEPTAHTKGVIEVAFTPTVPHCSMASLIGLCIRAKLMMAGVIPNGYKLDVNVVEGTHDTDADISKQLNDKERVSAALENPRLRELVDDCLDGVHRMEY